MPNRLINETSPYLLQHAHNPVDWYPWCEEALEKAKQEDKPVFLSIGYSSCHWCHVMERESFEKPEIAEIMNHNFINIKVDREERPDLDSVYMQAVTSLTGQGGWPMSVFLTPDGKPFFGGTYFPPEDRHGMPGFPRVLLAVAQAYHTRRSEIVSTASQLVHQIHQLSTPMQSKEHLSPDMFNTAFQLLLGNFDPLYGGLGKAPKFPQPMVYEFLLRHHHRSRITQALFMVEHTLEHMARGGIYDHLGGGFHRYSTDGQWLVPHFEKMLYDNALLARLYLHAYQATGKALYQRVARETLDYVLRDMTGPEGGFHSAQDADSEGEEGKYYLWTKDEIYQHLGAAEGNLFCAYFGVSRDGVLGGDNVLHLPKPHDEVAQELGMEPQALEQVIDSAKAKLLAVRQKRVPPGLDDKVLTSWNGLMLKSLSEAASILGDEKYRVAAVKNAHFLLDTLVKSGRVLRSYKDGQARVKGYLEDYSALIDALLAVHQATLDPAWLEQAVPLARSMVELFWDEQDGSFYDTGTDHEKLVVRPRDFFDNATPCGSSMAADVLLRLGVITGVSKFTNIAATALPNMSRWLTNHPQGFGHWLCALDFFLSAPKEIVVIGPLSNPATQQLLNTLHGHFIPNKVVVGAPARPEGAATSFSLLKDRDMLDGKPTAYVCQRYTCKLPVTNTAALREQLGLTTS